MSLSLKKADLPIRQTGCGFSHSSRQYMTGQASLPGMNGNAHSTVTTQPETKETA